MSKLRLFAPAFAGLCLMVNVHAGSFADAVVSYNPGTGFSAGFTNPAVVLGPPTSNATPFSPAFKTNQLISLGTNGSLVALFNPPIENDPTHPYGLDFTIFGNSGFVLTNNTQTSGALFGNNTNTTRVSVSQDGVNFYTLNPALAPTEDTFFPTDATGNPGLPVNPALATNPLGTNAFTGQTLAGIRALYQGAAGGGSYDISWAQDTNGNPVFLTWIKYIRVDVLGGKSEIDAIAAVTTPVATNTATFTENFGGNPANGGWQTFGNSNLFQWNPAGQYLNVTWDSSQPNSFFYHPLGNVLTTNDDFRVAFSLCLTNFAIGTTPGKPLNFEIAVSLFNLDSATNANFLRAAFPFNLPNLLDFDFFPGTPDDPEFATVGPTVFFSNNDFDFDGNAGDVTLTSNDVFQVQMTYTASNQTLATVVTRNGQPFDAIPSATFTSLAPDDFRLAQIGVMSYSDAGQTGDPEFFGSITAQGMLGNVVVTTPPPPVQNLTGGVTNNVWHSQFMSRSNWIYTLERAADLQSWQTASPPTPGTGGPLVLQDEKVIAGRGFYRVVATRP